MIDRIGEVVQGHVVESLARLPSPPMTRAASWQAFVCALIGVVGRILAQEAGDAYMAAPMADPTALSGHYAASFDGHRFAFAVEIEPDPGASGRYLATGGYGENPADAQEAKNWGDIRAPLMEANQAPAIKLDDGILRFVVPKSEPQKLGVLWKGRFLPRQPPPQRIEDFFLAAPPEWVGWSLAMRAALIRERPKGFTLDSGNGFIRYEAQDNPEEFEAAVFRAADGSRIFAFSVPHDPAFDNPATFVLLRYDRGRWLDVTKELFPSPIARASTYRLPRKGVTIEVRDAHKKLIEQWTWDRSKFVKGKGS
jgi:hypothetical protein